MYGRILNAHHETVRMFDATPRCAKDFCDDCGECLHCNPDECDSLRGGVHLWIAYEDNVDLIAHIDKESEPA